MSHFSLRLEGCRPESEDEEEVFAPLRTTPGRWPRVPPAPPLAAAAPRGAGVALHLSAPGLPGRAARAGPASRPIPRGSFWEVPAGLRGSRPHRLVLQMVVEAATCRAGRHRGSRARHRVSLLLGRFLFFNVEVHTLPA